MVQNTWCSYILPVYLNTLLIYVFCKWKKLLNSFKTLAADFDPSSIKTCSVPTANPFERISRILLSISFFTPCTVTPPYMWWAKMMIQSREADASPWLWHYLYVSLYSHKCEYSTQYLYVCLCNCLYMTWKNRKCAVKLFFLKNIYNPHPNEPDQIVCFCFLCVFVSVSMSFARVCVHISCLSGRVCVSVRCTNRQKPSLKARREREQLCL